MHLLYLTSAFPLPNYGNNMRTWSMLEALAAEGHGVTLLTFGQPGEFDAHAGALRQVCQNVEVIPLVLDGPSSTRNYLKLFLGLFCAQASTARRYASPEMRARIQDQMARNSYHAVLCDGLYTAFNLPTTRLPVLLYSHNVEHLIFQRYVALERNPLKRFYAWSEMRKLEKWEQEVCQRAAMVLACSEDDQRMLRSLCPGVRVMVVPNVVDLERYEPRYDTASHSIIFQGVMDWFPNRDAVEFFVTQIFPLLRREVPDARFIAAGRNPSSEMLARFSGLPGVKFTGTVPDIRPYMEQSAICAVPLRIGSGTRLKILEAAAAGKAIVSTRLGAEGLHFEDGIEIVLVDDPQGFADALKSLLLNPTKRASLGRAARRRVEQDYGYANLRECVREALGQFDPRAIPSTVTAGQNTVRN